MEIKEEFKQELIQELKHFPKQNRGELDTFECLKGIDTITYSFMFYYSNKNEAVILRIFRSMTDQTETEFSIDLILNIWSH